MGAFYGGIAHVPLSALVLVCELAGNYDLLVPLMLTQGIAFVALRHRALYHAQVATQHHSPVHRDASVTEILRSIRVQDLVPASAERPLWFSPQRTASEIARSVNEAPRQDVFPVVDAAGQLVGLITLDAIRLMAAEAAETRWLVAADLMQSPVFVTVDDNLRTATERMLANGLRELPVVTTDRRVVGLLDEADIASVYLNAAIRTDQAESVQP
jgi:CIC family chloride channel protein